MQAITESFNRTAKLALDDGSSATLDDAVKRFESFKIQIVVGAGIASSQSLQAALLTLINAAPRTFLGGVTVTGDVDVQLDLAWFKGKTLSQVLPELNARKADFSLNIPTIVVGEWIGKPGLFCIFLSCDGNEFTVGPDKPAPIQKDATIQTGVAAAGLALNEIFHHLYFNRALAGQRNITASLPSHSMDHEIALMQDDAWFIGLGHLGQAMLWVLSLTGMSPENKLQLRLQDHDHISESSLSTCLMSWNEDMGKLKVDVVSERLSQLGFICETVANKLVYDVLPKITKASVCVVAVDNISFRRGMDKLPSKRIIEAGIGDGINGFTQVQLHTLPSVRKAADIWAGSDPKATKIVSIEAPAYQDLLNKTKDACGTTQLAGRSIATPFIGAFAGACLFNLWDSNMSENNKQCAWNLDVNAL
jgi:hypothetical protein